MIKLLGDMSGWITVFFILILPVLVLAGGALYAVIMEFWNLDVKKVGTSR